MKEKRKNRHPKYRQLVIRCVQFLVGCLLIFAVFGSIVFLWVFGGYVKPTLDSEYLSEAQYLHNNPRDGFIQPVYSKNFWLGLNFQLNKKFTDYESRLCFDFTYVNDEDYDALSWTELTINKQIVRRSLYEWKYGFVYLTMPAHAIRCVDGRLDKGYHIIEFRMKDSPFSEPYYIRQIAVLVE